MDKSELLAVMAVGELLGYSVDAKPNVFGPKFWTAYVWKQGINAPTVVNTRRTTKTQAITYGWECVNEAILGGHNV
jgi:hypothetical protein